MTVPWWKLALPGLIFAAACVLFGVAVASIDNSNDRERDRDNRELSFDIAQEGCRAINENRAGLIDLAERFYEASGSPPDLLDDLEQFQIDYAPLDCSRASLERSRRASSRE